MNVRLSDEHGRLPFTRNQLKAIGKCILESLRFKEAEASFFFVGDRKIRALNRHYFGRRRATDVIAFSQWEGRPMPRLGNLLLGDVIISVDQAKRQAPRFGNSFRAEFALYMVHGVLHLVGYDDEKVGARMRMRKEEARILARIRKKFPGLLS